MSRAYPDSKLCLQWARLAEESTVLRHREKLAHCPQDKDNASPLSRDWQSDQIWFLSTQDYSLLTTTAWAVGLHLFCGNQGSGDHHKGCSSAHGCWYNSKSLMCAYTCREQRTTFGVSPLFYIEIGPSCCFCCLVQQACWAGFWRDFYFHLPSPCSLGLQMHAIVSIIFVRPKDSNSCLRTCTVGTFTHWVTWLPG